MRKLCVLMLIGLMIGGCGNDVGNVILFDSLSVDKEVKLSNDEGSPVCAVHLQLNYATKKNGEKAVTINNAIEQKLLDIYDMEMAHAADSFANAYTSSYVRNFLPLYNQDRGDTTKRSWYEYHYVITSLTQSGYPGTTAYIATIDYFEGGAHGINQQLTMNFDNQTGHLIQLEDVFVKGYEKPLSDILLKALCEKVGAKDLKVLHDKGYLFSMEMFPSRNFILNEETITFIYNPYEIAPYALGPTELTVAYEALDKILTNSMRP